MLVTKSAFHTYATIIKILDRIVAVDSTTITVAIESDRIYVTDTHNGATMAIDIPLHAICSVYVYSRPLHRTTELYFNLEDKDVDIETIVHHILNALEDAKVEIAKEGV